MELDKSDNIEGGIGEAAGLGERRGRFRRGEWAEPGENPVGSAMLGYATFSTSSA